MVQATKRSPELKIRTYEPPPADFDARTASDRLLLHHGFPTRPDSNDILERRASVIAGAAADNYSFFAGAQYYYMEPLLAKDRHTASASITDLLHVRDDKGNIGIAPPSYFSPSFPGRVQAGGVSYVLAGSPVAAGGPGYNPALNTPPVFPGQATIARKNRSR